MMASRTSLGHILGCILRVQLIRFVGGLKVQHGKKEGVSDDLKVLTKQLKERSCLSWKDCRKSRVGG